MYIPLIANEPAASRVLAHLMTLEPAATQAAIRGLPGFADFVLDTVECEALLPARGGRVDIRLNDAASPSPVLVETKIDAVLTEEQASRYMRHGRLLAVPAHPDDIPQFEEIEFARVAWGDLLDAIATQAGNAHSAELAQHLKRAVNIKWTRTRGTWLRLWQAVETACRMEAWEILAGLGWSSDLELRSPRLRNSQPITFWGPSHAIGDWQPWLQLELSPDLADLERPFKARLMLSHSVPEAERDDDAVPSYPTDLHRELWGAASPAAAFAPSDRQGARQHELRRRMIVSGTPASDLYGYVNLKYDEPFAELGRRWSCDSGGVTPGNIFVQRMFGYAAQLEGWLIEHSRA